LKKSLATLACFLIILMVGGVVVAVYDPSLVNQFTGKQDTTLSISSINVDPQGAPVGGQWTGSFWNILTYINANDQLAGVVLPKGQTGSVTYQDAATALQTGAKVEIQIDPGQPYLIRDVQEKLQPVAPSAVGLVGSSVSALSMDYYNWGEATWRVYTPFTVSIYKDGVLVGQPMTLNAQGADTVQSVSTPEGAVRIENLGTLGGQYLAPSAPSQIAILKGAPYVYDWAQIQSMVNGAQYDYNHVGSSANNYDDYWYGALRDTSGNAINHPVIFGFQSTTQYQPSSFGGWEGSDSGTSVSAVKPVVFSSDKSALPSDKQSFDSVTEWLQAKGVSNLATSLFNTQASGDAGALWQKASFVTDTNGQTALRLDIPWGALGTPLVSIRVPTELADTFVEQPIITSTTVSASWESTGTKNCDVYGANRIAVQVTNTGTVTGSTDLAITSTNSKLTVTPLSMTVNNLVPNVPQTVYFDATNLGVTGETDNVPITITASDTYTGAPTGSDTVYGSLMTTLNSGTTTLILNAVEKGTSTPIPSLQLSVQYAGQALPEFTNGNGQVTMTLTTPQGGAYTGQVVVSSADSATYKPATATYTLNSATAYTFTFEVERKDTNYGSNFNWMLVLEIVGIVAAIAVLAGAGFVVHKKMKHSKRRR
jgi:hypothetical protein